MQWEPWTTYRSVGVNTCTHLLGAHVNVLCVVTKELLRHFVHLRTFTSPGLVWETLLMLSSSAGVHVGVHRCSYYLLHYQTWPFHRNFSSMFIQNRSCTLLIRVSYCPSLCLTTTCGHRLLTTWSGTLYCTMGHTICMHIPRQLPAQSPGQGYCVCLCLGERWGTSKAQKNFKLY